MQSLLMFYYRSSAFLTSSSTFSRKSAAAKIFLSFHYRKHQSPLDTRHPLYKETLSFTYSSQLSRPQKINVLFFWQFIQQLPLNSAAYQPLGTKTTSLTISWCSLKSLSRHLLWLTGNYSCPPPCTIHYILPGSTLILKQDETRIEYTLQHCLPLTLRPSLQVST